jgi:hypothetical protein
MRWQCLSLFIVVSYLGFGQNNALTSESLNTADQLLQSTGTLTIGGYAQIDYNQPLEKEYYQNGKLDVHRLVLLFGYKFNQKTSFVTEVEWEHVKDIFVEQAFLNHRFNKYLNFRAGLLLIPMGIVNEYHEPPTFNGVERPNVDKFIVPTTWREIGAGFTGRFDRLALKYQAYLVNGFNGYDGSGTFTGENGLRSGRQKGAESVSSAPNVTFKFDYFGLPGLKVGLSGYFGDSQTTLYHGINKNDNTAVRQVDSSVVGISMLGLDMRYNFHGIQWRGQYNLAHLSNTDQYNAFTGNDVGSQMAGFYMDIGYDVFYTNKNMTTQLIPFIRYETYNTHKSVSSGLEVNDKFHRREFTLGIGWKLTPGAMLKMDYQWLKTKADPDYRNQFNLGVGIWFF